MTGLVARWPTQAAQLVLASRVDPPLRLHQRSEGWAAALSLHDSKDPARAARALEVRGRAIAKYFVAEVLDQQLVSEAQSLRAQLAQERGSHSRGASSLTAAELRWARGPSLAVWFFQCCFDVIPERHRHVGCRGDDPAESSYRGDHQEHLGDLILARARRQRPASAPFQAGRR
jgi:hypothetical protein